MFMKNNNKQNERISSKRKVVGVTKNDVGRAGETAACVYLRSKGHNILARNMKIGKGEIDILTAKDKTLHIIEVKTSQSDSPLAPEESLTPIKRKKLVALARNILASYPNHQIFQGLNVDEKIDRGLVLMDEPAIQIDGVAVRLTFTGMSISKVVVKYYPSIC